MAEGAHLHWHVAVIPPDTLPTFNGYYQDYVDDSGQQPEVIPLVCHQDGRTVLWRTGTYTAAGCPVKATWQPQSLLSLAAPASPLEALLRDIAGITNEAASIALWDPGLMLRTRRLMARMEPDFDDLLRLGRSRVSAEGLQMVVTLLRDYERRGSAELRRVLERVRAQLESPNGRQTLGIVVEDRFTGLD